MKTERFYIQFASCETDMSTQFEISKTEYYRQISHLEAQIESSRTNEYPVEEIELQVSRIETETTIEHRRCFTCGAADTYLVRLECKPGFRFQPKQ